MGHDHATAAALHPLDTALAKQALGLFLAKADRNVKRMTPTQIDEGQQLAREWEPDQ